MYLGLLESPCDTLQQLKIHEGTGSLIGKLIWNVQILKWYQKDFTSFS